MVRDESDLPGERVVMYEPFSGRTYWEGPSRSVTVTDPGAYRLIVWQEQGRTGDYVAVIGRQEQFGPKEIWLSMANTPLIRAKEELHVACESMAEATARGSR